MNHPIPRKPRHRGREAIGDFLWGVRDSMPRGNALKIRVLNQHLYRLGVSSRGRLITLIYRFVFVAPSGSMARSDLQILGSAKGRALFTGTCCANVRLPSKKKFISAPELSASRHCQPMPLRPFALRLSSFIKSEFSPVSFF